MMTVMFVQDYDKNLKEAVLTQGLKLLSKQFGMSYLFCDLIDNLIQLHKK